MLEVPLSRELSRLAATFVVLASSSVDASTGDAVTRKRGFLLTAWLLFAMIVYLVVGLDYLVNGSTLFASIPPWIVYTTGVLEVVNFVFGLILFAWRKWAFYGICAVAGIVFLLDLLRGTSLIYAASGLLAPFVLFLLLLPKWRMLD